MEVNVHEKKFVCIEYPGIISNSEKALETLGDEKGISKVYSEPSRRLELRFRPDDAYCKCTHGDRFNTTNLLMKITRHRKKNGTLKDSSITKAEILGTVETTYKFRSLMDYQYLPMQQCSDSGSGYESLLPVLIPEGMKLSSWIQEEPIAPVFVQPPLFSRFDQPSNYHFRKDPQQRDPNKSLSEHPPNIIGRSRKPRSGFAIFLNHEDTPAPKKCTPESLKLLHQKKGELKHKGPLEKAFQERPIWSRNSLAAVIKVETSQFKFLLPTLAYYFLTGPWRTFWVRFGYDPRLEPGAKIYQTLDVRIRIPPIPGIQFTYKRSIQLYNLPNKTCPPQGRIGTIEKETFLKAVDEKEEAQAPQLGLPCTYISGQMPKHRQIFYQVCDVEMQQVQELVHKNDGQETICHEKEGWCLPGTLEKCRELVLKDVRNTIERLKQENKASEVLEENELENDDSDYKPDEDEMDDLLEYEDADT